MKVQLPNKYDAAQYTMQVMAKVRAIGQAGERVVSRWSWVNLSRLGLATAAVAVGFLIVLTRGPREDAGRLAESIFHEAQVVEQLDETAQMVSAANDVDALTQEMQLLDTMMLAEAPPSDEQWIEQTIQLLDSVDDGTSAEQSAEPASEDEWLNELQMLDELEPAARS